MIPLQKWCRIRRIKKFDRFKWQLNVKVRIWSIRNAYIIWTFLKNFTGINILRKNNVAVGELGVSIIAILEVLISHLILQGKQVSDFKGI